MQSNSSFNEVQISICGRCGVSKCLHGGRLAIADLRAMGVPHPYKLPNHYVLATVAWFHNLPVTVEEQSAALAAPRYLALNPWL